MNSANKVLLFGDSGVGKSTLVNTLCGVPNSRPQSTIGCATQVLAHQYGAGTPHEEMEFIELWDIGGSNAHREAVSVFFENASGVIFVHDLSNSKSEENLAQWSNLFNNYRIVQSNQSMHRLTTDYSSPFCDVERLSSFPTLIVGSRLDLASHRAKNFHNRSTIPELRQFDCVFLDCRKEILPGSTNRLIFSRFFDAVVDKSKSLEDRSFSHARRRRFI